MQPKLTFFLVIYIHTYFALKPSPATAIWYLLELSVASLAYPYANGITAINFKLMFCANQAVISNFLLSAVRAQHLNCTSSAAQLRRQSMQWMQLATAALCSSSNLRRFCKMTVQLHLQGVKLSWKISNNLLQQTYYVMRHCSCDWGWSECALYQGFQKSQLPLSLRHEFANIAYKCMNVCVCICIWLCECIRLWLVGGVAR